MFFNVFRRKPSLGVPGFCQNFQANRLYEIKDSKQYKFEWIFNYIGKRF